MPKRKKLKSKPKNISPETGMVLEYFEDQIKVIAEQTSEIPAISKKVGKLERLIEDISVNIDAIKISMRSMKEAMETMKTDMELMKYGLKRKIDIDEFALLEKRVSNLENRL